MNCATAVDFLEAVVEAVQCWGSKAPKANMDGFNRAMVTISDPVEYEDSLNMKIERSLWNDLPGFLLEVEYARYDGQIRHIKTYSVTTTQEVIVTIMYWVTHQAYCPERVEVVQKLMKLL